MSTRAMLRGLLPAVLALGGLLALVPAASATEPTPVLQITAQAQQANATFLAYAPAPAGGPGALCLIDTGVNANPDTAPGLIGSYAIDNGPTDDVDPQGHGTSMAMIAGGAGTGILGAWPQLKIVSVRATDAPSPGQEPTFDFDDYWQGMQYCANAPASDHVKAVDLALASQIPPSPDEAASFATVVGNLEGQRIAVVAAAGNNPGAVEEPGAEPNVFAVGADTAQDGGTYSQTSTGQVCSFSANQGVGLNAPGCALDGADPFSDQPYCCADGTSQASAFTAAVIVAMMSYDPTLSYTKAENLLTQTANDGDLDVGAAFEADGLGQIVSEGTANTPQPASTTTTTTSSTTTTNGTTHPARKVTVRSVRWRRGILTIKLSGMQRRDQVRITLTYARNRPRRARSARATIRLRTRRPRRIVIRVFAGKTAISSPTTVKM